MEHILDNIIFDNNPVVVGVSSGPDSMCLLNLLEQKTNKLVVCHINHNVRKESTTEEEYLKDYCQKHNLIFESMKITEYKETNFENEARKKRYNFYEKILSKYHSTKLFLAHHGDDQIETILMKIVRGSNLEGYAGIKEISTHKDYTIIRPFLSYTKEDLLDYDERNNIELEEQDVITLEFDDGLEVECAIMGVFECDGKEYIALDAQDGTDDVYIYGYKEVGEEEFELVDLEDEEFDKAVAEFDAIMAEMDEE